MDKDEAMAARMKMDAEDFESETVGAEVEIEESPEFALTVDEFNELRAQQAQLMKALEEERLQRQLLTEALDKVQTHSPLTVGEETVLDDGREWGPFADYEFVTTPYGEYAVPITRVLYFIGVQRVNKETLQIETLPLPRYRNATEEERAEVKLPSMEPLPSAVINPPRTFEESMEKMAEYLEGRAEQGLTHVPVVPTD